MSAHLTKMTISAHIGNDHEVYEGNALMSQDQQDKYKAIIGDGLARVSVGCDKSEKDFGNGGGVIVNVSLTCDQSTTKLNEAIALAHEIADGAVQYYHKQLQQRLITEGILRPIKQ